MTPIGASSGPKKKTERLGRPSTHLRVIQINDVYQLDNFPSFRTLVDHYSRGGADVDAGCNDEQAPDETIVLLSGDFVSPSLLSSLDRGRGIIDVMGKAGITHVCLGNHEADIDPAALADRIRESNFCWVNSNMRALDSALAVDTAPHDIVTVRSGDGTHTRTVAILGFLTEDSSIYKTDAFNGALEDIEPVLESAEHWVSTLGKQHGAIDLFLPMTHQDRSRDRELAKKFGGETFPVIPGGHDHDASDETVNECRILKVGMDGIQAAIIDFVWCSSASDRPKVAVDIVKVSSFLPNHEVQCRVNCHKRILAELETARLFDISKAKMMTLRDPTAEFSTRNNRFGTTKGSTCLVSFLRKAMNAECAILNAGGIRGNSEYIGDWFTYADLKSEFPFEDPVVTVRIPGTVLKDAISYSRRLSREEPPKEESGFLHTCEMIEFADDGQHILYINDQAFDADKLYLVAVPVSILNGLDNIVPLLTWKEKEHVCVREDVGRPIKIVLVELFALSFWLALGSVDWEADTDEDGCLTQEKIMEKFQEEYGPDVSNVMVKDVLAVADVNGDGRINLDEILVAQLSAHIKHEPYQPVRRVNRRVTHVLERMASSNLKMSVSRSIVQRTVKSAKDLFKSLDN